jgi:carboxymethylenebutenolidase
MAEKVTLKVSDGTEILTYVARPQKQAKAGVIVLQEAFGITDHIKRVTDRFAHEGYLAIAPELYHRTAPPGFAAKYGEFETVKPHSSALTLPNLEADTKTAFDWLKSQGVGKIASVGYCQGGRVSYIANSTLPLSAAVSYYGRIAPDLLDRAKDQQAPIVLFWGGLDKGISIEGARAVSDALRTAGKPFTHIEFSDAQHGFNCDDRPSFHPEASEQAWGITLTFFKKHLSDIIQGGVILNHTKAPSSTI